MISGFGTSSTTRMPMSRNSQLLQHCITRGVGNSTESRTPWPESCQNPTESNRIQQNLVDNFRIVRVSQNHQNRLESSRIIKNHEKWA
ncbi:hypothetical protein OUZ56_016732 [Daphnia magna]|uniref:Uncharacterized protein n=1 Tax=Daphnia magna TaxID=35525 RepID=A0ABR0ARI4_9CRUS|nr:hypothetical protein OUZ56_016732 [Daphnia magna]